MAPAAALLLGGGALLIALFRDAWFALVWRACTRRVDAALRGVKRSLLAPLAGVVVEIGAGVGSSLPYFSPAVTALHLVEPNAAMHAALRAAVRASAHPRAAVLGCGAEALPLASGSVDAVVCVLTLCSIDDVPAAAREAHRVLRRGGRFVFVEHVRAAPGLVSALQRVADATFVYPALAGGCRLHRDSVAAIERALPPGAWARVDATSAPHPRGFPLPLAWGSATKA